MIWKILRFSYMTNNLKIKKILWNWLDQILTHIYNLFCILVPRLHLFGLALKTRYNYCYILYKEVFIIKHFGWSSWKVCAGLLFQRSSWFQKLLSSRYKNKRFNVIIISWRDILKHMNNFLIDKTIDVIPVNLNGYLQIVT